MTTLSVALGSVVVTPVRAFVRIASRGWMTTLSPALRSVVVAPVRAFVQDYTPIHKSGSTCQTRLFGMSETYMLIFGRLTNIISVRLIERIVCV
jgi:hypothetical protein